MTHASTSSIHDSAAIDASALVHPSATIDEGVVVGAGAIVGPGCTIGARTRLRARCILDENVTLGPDNDVHSFAVIGGDPQDRGYDGTERGSVIIGAGNIFREGVTISRSTGDATPTRVGDNNYLMTGCHVGHNAQLGSNVTMTNCASLAGHVSVGDGCVLSSYVGIHQFTRVGELVMFRGLAGVGMHVPPYVIVSDVNTIAGLNKVGLDRHGSFTDEDRAQIKRVYRAIYRERGARSMTATIDDLRALGLGAPAMRFVDFIDRATTETGRHARGIVGHR